MWLVSCHDHEYMVGWLEFDQTVGYPGEGHKHAKWAGEMNPDAVLRLWTFNGTVGSNYVEVVREQVADIIFVQENQLRGEKYIEWENRIRAEKFDVIGNESGDGPNRGCGWWCGDYGAQRH